MRPQRVLDQLRKRTTELGLPKIGLHDLRHTAASIMIAENIPLAIVSKTLRHSTLATTINLYGHLFKDSADQAVHALARALDRAELSRPRFHRGKAKVPCPWPRSHAPRTGLSEAGVCTVHGPLKAGWRQRGTASWFSVVP
ncbi:tyrosine-type recombinase/integrase [Kitasatospora sp. NPDC059795]|uniref:tyrosine-type recombinase/integrase n=1 Tax=Kitasatospora sp. NPDC059795 TaxID=3346949 RepID=UPI00365AE4C6